MISLINNKSHSRIILILALVVLLSCTEQNQQSGLSGTLIGYVKGFDKNASPLADQSGIEISIEGASEPISLVTDHEGKFEITDLKTGTYNIIFSKAGFGIHKIIGYGFVGGENPVSVSASLFELPGAVVENIELKDMSNSFQVQVECKVLVDLPAQVSNSGIYRYYLSNTSSISISNYLETGVVYANAGGGTFTFVKLINTSLFPRGSDVYITVLPCTEPYQNYIDIETGNLVFSSVKPESVKVADFKVPE